MIYQTHVITQNFKSQGGSHSQLSLEVECLRDLDQTIDDLFVELSRTGDASLLEERCPYFGKVWPSALALAEAVLAREAEFKGARVLELGCGLALPSLVAARLGAKVTATDFHPDVPAFLKENLQRNKIPGHELDLRYEELSWAKAVTSELANHSFDWVIGSDVLYERAHGQQLADTLSRFLVSSGGKALIADPGRPYLQGFTEELLRKKIGHQTQVLGEIFLIEVSN